MVLETDPGWGSRSRPIQGITFPSSPRRTSPLGGSATSRSPGSNGGTGNAAATIPPARTSPGAGGGSISSGCYTYDGGRGTEVRASVRVSAGGCEECDIDKGLRFTRKAGSRSGRGAVVLGMLSALGLLACTPLLGTLWPSPSPTRSSSLSSGAAATATATGGSAQQQRTYTVTAAPPTPKMPKNSAKTTAAAEAAVKAAAATAGAAAAAAAATTTTTPDPAKSTATLDLPQADQVPRTTTQEVTPAGANAAAEAPWSEGVAAPEAGAGLRGDSSGSPSPGRAGDGAARDGKPRCWTDGGGNGRCLPTVFFFGVSKCGTTSLSNWLAKHPRMVFVPPPEGHDFKEAHVFDGSPKFWHNLSLQDRREILSPVAGPGDTVIDYTPNYAVSGDAPHRIFDFYDAGGADGGRLLKKIKFLVLLREPVARVISSWGYKSEPAAAAEAADFSEPSTSRPQPSLYGTASNGGTGSDYNTTSAASPTSNSLGFNDHLAFAEGRRNMMSAQGAAEAAAAKAAATVNAAEAAGAATNAAETANASVVAGAAAAAAAAAGARAATKTSVARRGESTRPRPRPSEGSTPRRAEVERRRLSTVAMVEQRELGQAFREGVEGVGRLSDCVRGAEDSGLFGREVTARICRRSKGKKQCHGSPPCELCNTHTEPWCNPRDYLEESLYNAHVGKSMYAMQLKRWFGVFGRENFKVIFTEDMETEPLKTLEEVLEFMGLGMLDPRGVKGLRNLEEWESVVGARYNTADAAKKAILNSQATPELREEMREFFAPHNKELEDLLGVKLPASWHVQR